MELSLLLQTVGGIPLALVVFILVELLKAFGLKGKALLASSFGIGVLVGAVFNIAVDGLPAQFADWVGLVSYGLVIGGFASLFYNRLKALVEKALLKWFNALEAEVFSTPEDSGEEPVA